MKDLLFVMNPYAGMRKANRYLPEIISVFNRADYSVRAYMTAGPGDAADYIRANCTAADLVVCAGGDGTFNETVTGVLSCGQDIPIGYIPCGSTNDFASSLHLQTHAVRAAEDIVAGSPVRYDVGLFNGRYFTYVASFGAFTKASYSTPQNIKNALGHTAYLLSGLQELSQLHTEHIRMETDSGVIEDDFLFGAISNSTSVGGILNLDPNQVDMQDGKFEILLVRAPKDFAEVHECIWAMQKQIYNCAMVTFCSSSQLKITADPDMPWTLDGEKAEGAEEIHIKNLSRAIRLMKRG